MEFSQGWVVVTLLCLLAPCRGLSLERLTRLSPERIVFQTEFGVMELALYPEAAPQTYKHILALAKLGAYNTNHFFRVDKGFVAQTADCSYGRSTPPDARIRALDSEKVPLEVHKELKHHKRGLLSMARHSDPNSGGSSFSIMLNPAPHLDMEYSVFGEVTEGIETLAKMEEVETTKDGIFVMPKVRIEIKSSYVYTPTQHVGGSDSCEAKLEDLQTRFDAQAKELHAKRSRALP